MNKLKKRKLQLLSLCTGFVALTLGVLFTSGKGLGSFTPSIAGKTTSNYSMTLDSSNKVTSNGDHDQYNKAGWKIAYAYSGVANSTTGHVTLSNGGTIANKTQITSISAVTANYTGEGSLKARISYINESAKFGSYFPLYSGSRVETGSNPYYIEFKADGGTVTVSSIKIEYTCQENKDAESSIVNSSFTITFATGSNKDGTGLTTSTSIGSVISSGASYVSSITNITNAYYGSTDGLKVGKRNNGPAGSVTLNLNSTYNVSSIVVNAKLYNANNSATLNVNSVGTQNLGESFSNKTYAINSNINTITLDSSKYIYISGLTVNYSEGTEPGQPVNPSAYEIGFTADDLNKDTYTTNSVFATASNIAVYSLKSDNTQTAIDVGSYSYEIRNSLDQAINPNEKFPEVGTYTLIVTYSNYIPQEITLHVGEYIYIVDVSAAMTTTTFNTASILANNLQGNLTATLELSSGGHSSAIDYNSFAANNIAVKLLTPKGITYDITKPFGTAGSWTLKVYDKNDEEMYYTISLTINAIPVETISLTPTSKTLYPDDKLQLTATVGPETATNQVYTWSSNNEDVARVSESGLVTAIAVGGATIKATAIDGSNVFGSCIITVVAKPEGPEWEEITDAAKIKVGDEIVIAYENGATLKELSGMHAGQGTSGKPYGSAETYDLSGEPNGLYPLTVVNGSSSGTYALQNGSSYLYWNDGNSLTDSASISANSSWTFTGTSTIANAANSSRSIRYNASSPRFACYEGTQQDITIFKHNIATTPVYPLSITLSGTSSISIGGTSELTVNYSPSDTNVKNVTFTSSNENVATVSSDGIVTGVAQGTSTITATAQTANNGTTTATLTVSVSPIAVTSVSLSSVSESIKVGKTVTLAPSISPANATNKDVTWKSSDTTVATVSSAGVVTGVSPGTATITVTTVSGNKTANCTVVVQAASAGGEETASITYTDLPITYQTGSTIYTADSGIKFQAYNCANYSGKMQFKASSGYLQTTEELELQSVTINDRESNILTVYGSNTAGSFSTEITGNNDVYDLTGYSYFKIARTVNGAAYCSSITVVTGTPTPTDPTSILLSPTTADVSAGGSKQLSVSYVPSNANQNKEITWTSSNTNVATVNSEGLVSVKSTATAGQTATITAKLTNITSILATCKITVTAQTKDDHTVLIYMCGADLESKNQLASGDIREILKVSGQPDDVNIVIETGGASSWASTYGISSTYLERYHVENKSLVRDTQLTYASMGLTSTLQSFIEYGLNNFPAERTGLVFWNHGGGMRGVCYDEKKNDDVLKNSEIRSAVSGALSNCGMSGQKLEWVGYDACLMAVQDIAITNAQYFNYMIASEESEAGYGWDYDNWVDDLYAKKPTTTILKAIVDSFISDNGGSSSTSGDQTLSYMNLAYAEAYKTAWENLASQLNNVVTTNNKSSFNSAITSNVKHYADSDYDYFCTFDAWDFVDKLANNAAFSSFSVGSSYITAVKNAHANLVEYNLAQKGAGVSKGLCMYWPNSTQYSDVKTYYTTSETTLTTWRSFCVNKGTHA